MKQFTLIIPLLVISCFLTNSFGQTYSGPATGSVTSGVVVTTDDFTFMPNGSEVSEEPGVYEIMEYDAPPMHYKGDKQVFDNYVYIEDENVNSTAGNDIGINFQLHSFESIPFESGWPPDPAMSVGPDHVIAAVNGRFNIYDRDGNQLKSIDENVWVGQVILAPVISDPQVIYDHHKGRWVMLWFTRIESILEAPFAICYSDDENPLGTWYMYAIGSELNGSTYAGNWGDYPKIGYDDQALYINSRQFGFAGTGYDYNKLRILNSAEFYAAEGGPISWTDFWDIQVQGQAVDVIHPCYSYDTGINSAYFVYARSGSGPTDSYVLFKITDPITNPVLSGVSLPIPIYYRAPDAHQLGGDQTVDVFTWIAKAPVLRDGKIYASHSIRNTQFTAYASLKYFVIDINTNSVIEQVEQGAQGYYYITPAITVDKDHNIAITYSRSADTEYIGAFYSTKLATDPPGLSQSQVMVEGQGYVGHDSGRWGDYFSAAVDPVNQYNIWLFSEFKSATADWSTWLTEIRMKPFSGVYGFIDNKTFDFGNIELGNTSDVFVAQVANYGDVDLTITDIPATVGDFNLQTSQTLPATLGTYDSLQIEITYTPTTLGVAQEFFSISSNDPNVTGIAVTGNGYHIIPAYSEIFYGSTGPYNNGDIITISRTTGQGSTIGNSLYNEVTSLTVNPITNELYGLISAGTANPEIVRINVEDGDAYTLYPLDLSLLTGIAFNSTETLYISVRTGEIYTVDLLSGDYTLVTTSTEAINAIAFDPQTDQLWAAYWRAIGNTKDGIYTIDLTTGNATLIGETGFDVLTNDIAFDENGTLYGVIGISTENGQLITINTNDGSGTVVGDIGIQNVVGLGYSLNGPASVEEEDDTNIPADYSLAQNYPNPFNPSTSIEYSLPVYSNVTIRVYNLLGEVIMTLVNEDKGAGHHSVTWNGSDESGKQVSSGIYFYEMKANGDNGRTYSQIMKMVFLK